MFDFFKVQKVAHKKEEVEIATDYENIPAISKYFKNETGIDFDDQAVIFKSKLTSFCRTHKIASFEDCLNLMDTDKTLRQELIDYLTTNESYFYRELHQIEDLVQNVKASSKNVKILCVPCANGEEPYSIAIALMNSGVAASRFSIEGIDISCDAVKRSEEAIYNEKAIRNLSQDLRSKYFSQNNGAHHLNQEVKNQVSFQCMNIFDEEFNRLGQFNYIFSRNMLIYFDTQTRIKAQKLFRDHLVDSTGDIYFGHADLTHEHS